VVSSLAYPNLLGTKRLGCCCCCCCCLLSLVGKVDGEKGVCPVAVHKRKTLVPFSL
jgi:hypothetical protein